MPKCCICDREYETGRELTCSAECHEELAKRLIAEFGEFKKVIRQSTGVAYKVPTRDIIERGLKEEELDRYPRWEGTKALICAPTSLEGYVPPGSLPDKCSKCGQPVWVAPSSLLIMHDNPGMVVLCKPCALRQMKKAKHPKIEDITPAQAEEIDEYLRKGS